MCQVCAAAKCIAKWFCLHKEPHRAKAAGQLIADCSLTYVTYVVHVQLSKLVDIFELCFLFLEAL